MLASQLLIKLTLQFGDPASVDVHDYNGGEEATAVTGVTVLCVGQCLKVTICLENDADCWKPLTSKTL